MSFSSLTYRLSKALPASCPRGMPVRPRRLGDGAQALLAAALVMLSGIAANTAAFATGLTEADRRAYARPDSVPFPPDNPYTPEKAALGKMLYFDTRLSRDRNLNCVSCHNPSFGWEVPFDLAVGAGGKPLGRHSPTVINLAWTDELFWDGRASSLEDQARGPIEADVEMDLPMAVAVERLQAVQGYRDIFAAAFPGEGITVENILKALATFERTIVTGETPFDRWIAGDETALNASAKAGFALFNGKAGCAECHSGWNFTDNAFHDIGMPTEDLGRAVVSGRAADNHAFKTPGLRQIVERAPYMHNGSLRTLEQVVAHYVSGGVARESLSPLMKPRPLDARELADLVAFMESLSSLRNRQSMPNLPAN